METPDAPRRRHILDAAHRLLLRHGPAKTTMADIAREVGIAVGTLYLAFASKDAIVEELASEKHRQVLSAMREAAAPGPPSFAHRFRAVMEARFESMIRLADAGSHAAELFHCGHGCVLNAHARFQIAERELLGALFRDAQRADEFHVQDPDDSARVVLRAYASFSPPWVFAMERDEARTALRAMHELVLDGLRARSGGHSHAKG